MDNSNKKHRSFEEKWQDAFDGAEEMPSAGLWKNIESSINAAENSQYKRRFIFYRGVAAAAIACLVLLGVFTLGSYLKNPYTEHNNGTVADKTENQVENSRDNSSEKNNPDQQEQSISSENQNSEKALAEKNDRASQEMGNANGSSRNNADGNSSYFSNGSPSNNGNAGTKRNSNSYLDTQNSQQNTGINAQKNQYVKWNVGEPGEQQFRSGAPAVMLASLSSNDVKDLYGTPLEDLQVNETVYRVPVMIRDEKKQKPTFFAGVNVSTDYFDPNFNNGRSNNDFAPAPLNYGLASSDKLNQGNYYQQDELQNAKIENGEDNKPKLSFTYGVNFGIAIAKNWTIESGLSFGRMQTSTSTSTSVRKHSTQEAYPVVVSNRAATAMASEYSTARYTPVDLSSYYDFFSVPVKLGYNLRFNKLNIVFASGVAANFFVKNSISDNTGQLSELTIKADDGAFRSVYYSAVVSSGVNYNIWDNYFLSVIPNYSFSINSLSKNESEFLSNPYSFGVDFGIRYLF